MFSESEGPTALRQDLIRALSLSAGPGQMQGASGAESACAALSAVWNGRKGYVAVLVRSLETKTIQRYTYADAIRTELELDGAVDEGLAFAESFGFVMDDPTFVELGPIEQKERLDSWNQLRKTSRYPEFARPHDRSVEPDTNPGTIDLAEACAPTAAPEGEFDDAPVARSEPVPAAAVAPGDEDPEGKAVLGRISIVRRQAAGPRARLLSQF